jgi:AraC-like DNA-binding protein
MKIIGIGQVNVWDGGSLWIGLAKAGTQRHAHHAIQLSLGLKGQVRIQSGPDDGWAAYDAVLVPPHVTHAFEASGSVVANIFCEPESVVGRRLLVRFGPDAVTRLSDSETAVLANRMHREYLADGGDEALNHCAREVLRELAQLAPAASRAADPRIVRAIAEITRRLDRPISLEDIAGTIHLSPSRFRHLFVAETGVPFRPYVLWRRLQHALALGISGMSWTEAAHAANFADSAHLTRTFRKMFGVAPSALDQLRQEDGRASLAGAA